MQRLYPVVHDPVHAIEHARDVIADAPSIDELSDHDVAAIYTYPPSERWVRANMVGSLDGVASVDGVTATLSSAPDRRVFRLLRALADVILVGAGTVRAEGYRPAKVAEQWSGLREANGQQPTPPIAVVTRSLDLDPESALFTGDGPRPIVLTCTDAPSDRRAALTEVADVVDCGPSSVDPASALDALNERGLRRVLCEGGPTFLHELVAAGLIDELCLTIAPVLVSGDERQVLHGPTFDPPRDFRLGTILEEGGVLLTRYLRPDVA